MESINGVVSSLPQQQRQNPQYLPLFTEGVSLLLSRWTALQMAIENEWGGKLSRRNAELLASDIISFFTQPKSKDPTLYIDDLEDLLFVNTRDSFNLVAEDGSIEEIAEELMVMHEELLHGELKTIQKLRKSGSASDAVSRSKAVAINMNEDDDDSSSDDESDMAVDEPIPKIDPGFVLMPMYEQKKQETVVDEDGWSTVPSRRNKGGGGQF